MSDDSILLAKEMFFKYGGSHFHMEREGEYKSYKSFDISKEQESLWIEELQKELLDKVKKDDVVGHNYNTLCSSIRQYKSLDMLKELVDFVKSRREASDTFSLLLMAEGELRIVEYFEKNNLGAHKNTAFARVTSLEILEYLLKRPVSVAAEYLNSSHLVDLSDNQYILNRIRDELANRP